jgi:hypothetical protein
MLTSCVFAATGEPEGILWRVSEKYKPDAEDPARINATLLALVRNEELPGMLQAMKDLERTWNHKFNYPWTFFNDVPFSEEFKKKTQAETKAECRYGRLLGILLRPLVLTSYTLQSSSLRSTGICPPGSTRISTKNPSRSSRKTTFNTPTNYPTTKCAAGTAACSTVTRPSKMCATIGASSRRCTSSATSTTTSSATCMTTIRRTASP